MQGGIALNEFIIDGAEMFTKEKAHEYLREKLHFPDYYGNNLDGLWDVLSTIDSDTQIIMKNRDQLMKALPEYGEKLINTFVDAALANEKLVLSFLD